MLTPPTPAAPRLVLLHQAAAQQGGAADAASGQQRVGGRHAAGRGQGAGGAQPAELVSWLVAHNAGVARKHQGSTCAEGACTAAPQGLGSRLQGCAFRCMAAVFVRSATIATTVVFCSAGGRNLWGPMPEQEIKAGKQVLHRPSYNDGQLEVRAAKAWSRLCVALLHPHGCCKGLGSVMHKLCMQQGAQLSLTEDY